MIRLMTPDHSPTVSVLTQTAWPSTVNTLLVASMASSGPSSALPQWMRVAVARLRYDAATRTLTQQSTVARLLVQNIGGSGAASASRHQVLPWSSRTTEQSRPVSPEYTMSGIVRPNTGTTAMLATVIIASPGPAQAPSNNTGTTAREHHDITASWPRKVNKPLRPA